MSITYEEALETLQTMFGEPWSRETLDVVLRHHGGHMENTIETVLSHADRDPQILVHTLKSNVSIDEEIARQLEQEERVRNNQLVIAPSRNAVPLSSSSSSSLTQQPPLSLSSSSAAAAAAASSQRELRGTHTTLPPDFLVIPGRAPLSHIHNNNTNSTIHPITNATNPNSTMDADEALARMLQDEFFAEELAHNPEFAHLARGRPRTVGGVPIRPPGMSTTTSQGRVGELPSRNTTTNGNPTSNAQDFNIMDKLSELGDNARRRLATLAAQFHANRNQNNPNDQARGGAGGSSGINTERRSLLDDDDDDAIEFMSRKTK